MPLVYRVRREGAVYLCSCLPALFWFYPAWATSSPTLFSASVGSLPRLLLVFLPPTLLCLAASPPLGFILFRVTAVSGMYRFLLVTVTAVWSGYQFLFGYSFWVVNSFFLFVKKFRKS